MTCDERARKAVQPGPMQDREQQRSKLLHRRALPRAGDAVPVPIAQYSLANTLQRPRHPTSHTPPTRHHSSVPYPRQQGIHATEAREQTTSKPAGRSSVHTYVCVCALDSGEGGVLQMQWGEKARAREHTAENDIKRADKRSGATCHRTSTHLTAHRASHATHPLLRFALAHPSKHHATHRSLPSSPSPSILPSPHSPSLQPSHHHRQPKNGCGGRGAGAYDGLCGSVPLAEASLDCQGARGGAGKAAGHLLQQHLRVRHDAVASGDRPHAQRPHGGDRTAREGRTNRGKKKKDEDEERDGRALGGCCLIGGHKQPQSSEEHGVKHH
eukprot:m.53846 g.53846  ORF g.53846 m.53846 type:complete len:327 (-) comp12414_c0_seq1:392-1372(-)